ncbi:MAG: hypothetical protein FWD87_05130 [Spirochaetaceae bacterium]|nr:hypothetical protein [Spirochaetaceae bacterium]
MVKINCKANIAEKLNELFKLEGFVESPAHKQGDVTIKEYCHCERGRVTIIINTSTGE